jgi:hypothetical protein
MAKKFPLGRVRELAGHVASMHETLQGLLADCDAASDDGPIKSTARDDSDVAEPYAQGQDSGTRPVSMDKAFPEFNRLGAGLPANILNRK